jgi:hypothetical protein
MTHFHLLTMEHEAKNGIAMINLMELHGIQVSTYYEYIFIFR